MTPGYSITITGEGDAKAKFDKIGPSLVGPKLGLSRVMGEAATICVKENFLRLDGSRVNTLGGKRSHFYRQAAEATSYEATADGAVVNVAGPHGIRQRLLGGTITAVNGKYLAIPARTEAYGVSPRNFPETLKFVRFGSGAAALVKEESRNPDEESVDDAGNVTVKRGKKNRRKRTAGLVEYWLVPSVTQAADPYVFPSEAAVASAVKEAAMVYLKGFNL